MALTREILIKELEEYPFFLSTQKVAEILSVSKATVINLFKTSQIKGKKVGKIIKIPKENLIDYILKDENIN